MQFTLLALQEWLVIDFEELWSTKQAENLTHVDKNSVDVIDENTLHSQSGSKSEEETSQKENTLNEVKKELEAVLNKSNVQDASPTITKPIETDQAKLDQTEERIQESASVPSKPPTPETFPIETRERSRSSSDPEVYKQKKPKKYEKKPRNISNVVIPKPNRGNVEHVKPSTPPVPQPAVNTTNTNSSESSSSTTTRKSQHQSTPTPLKRKTSGGSSKSASDNINKVPERILLRSAPSADGTAQPILKKIKQMNLNNSNDASVTPSTSNATQMDKKDHRTNSKASGGNKKHNTQSITSSQKDSPDQRSKHFELLDNLESQNNFENSPEFVPAWSNNVIQRNMTPTQRSRSPSPVLPTVMQPHQHQQLHTQQLYQQHHQQHGNNQLIDRLTQAFQPRQEQPGYFSLFSNDNGNTSPWGSRNTSHGGDDYSQQQMNTNSFFSSHPFGSPTSPQNQQNNFGSFDRFAGGYGAFGQYGPANNNRDFLLHEPPRERFLPPHSLMSNNSSSFFSYSPSRFTFIPPVRSDFEEEELNDFELDAANTSRSNSSENMSTSSSQSPSFDSVTPTNE